MLNNKKLGPTEKAERKNQNSCFDNIYQNKDKQEDVNRYADLLINYSKVIDAIQRINGSWKPIWTDIHQEKYTIYLFGNEICESINTLKKEPLCFQSVQKRQEFMDTITNEEIIKFLNGIYHGVNQ